MIPYRQIEHTADVGLEIYGSSINELFINSVKGLFYLISPRLKVARAEIPRSPSILELDSPTQEELLVHWLNEFIYNFFVKGLFPKAIRINELKGKNIEAEVEFANYSKAQRISLEIKAATYHDLSIQRINNKYQARVIFDV